jgi:hypothetical protein
MRFGRRVVVIAMFFLSMTLGTGLALPTAQAMDCTKAAFDALHLTDLQYNQPVTIDGSPTGTRIVAATATVPEYCLVTGTIYPQIGFAVGLPTATWNGNFYMSGGGGFNGTIPGLNTGLSLHYATAGTDSGHKSSDYPSSDAAKFAWPDTDALPAQRKIDFAYRSYNETAVLAKKIIKAFYGYNTRYSYFVGCSEGGREGLMMTQRFPELFDGILAGSAIFYMTRAHMRSVWDEQALQGTSAITANQLPYFASVVYNKCDGIDGLVDGLIDDPRKCPFDPAKDLPVCAVASPTCFTPDQITALEKIYGGPKTSWGQQLFVGQVPGSEALWNGNFIGNNNTQLSSGQTSMRYLSVSPQLGPTWSFTQYNFDTDPPKMAGPSLLFDTINPNLGAFKERGGKMIQYHGWADPGVPPLMSINYYETVLQTIGDNNTMEFYELYLVPGMGHCGGGVSNNASTVDWFTPLVDWVEKGIAPKTLIGSRSVSGTVVRSRPQCPYPAFERFVGKPGDSIDDAANFVCVAPTDVKVEPETLNLKSKGDFTAFIDYPPGYHPADWQITKVVCEGATATRGTLSGKDYVAKFNRQGVQNVGTGNAIKFTVTATAEYNGQQVMFEGSDTVRVIK